MCEIYTHNFHLTAFRWLVAMCAIQSILPMACPLPFPVVSQFMSLANAFECWIKQCFLFRMYRFQNSDGELKYQRDAEELIRPERNTLLVSYTDLEGFNQELATTIQEEFYR